MGLKRIRKEPVRSNCRITCLKKRKQFLTGEFINALIKKNMYFRMANKNHRSKIPEVIYRATFSGSKFDIQENIF
jgi:hypothetical protein